MLRLTRRRMLAAAATVAAALPVRKPRAEALQGLSALKLTDPPVPLPAITFYDAEGQAHRLSEFRGHGMAVNLWATWCAPCVAEMPALAALARALAPDDVAVLPLSSDRGGAEAVRGFFAQHGITGLPVLLDPKGAAQRALGAEGIPLTVLIDREGRERARLEGGADWATPDAIARVRALVEE